MLLRTSLATNVALQLLIAAGGFLHVEGKVGFGPGEQEWGFVTVRPKAHMFWWLYFTTDNVTDFRDRPLVIWLQGGPGGSSTGYGNFEELGPLDLDLNPRNYTWVKNYNVLFIDNPVGTGFSYVDHHSAFVENNTQIAKDLVECMKGFLAEFPEFEKIPTFITAESYGGKMASEFALEWDQAQKSGDIKSNLQGVALGDSWISPIDSVLSWASFLLETGMVDTDGFKKIEKSALETKLAVDNAEWIQATSLWDDTEDVIVNLTGNIDFYNILYKVEPLRKKSKFLRTAMARAEDRDDRLWNLMNQEVKKALGLNVMWDSSGVFGKLAEDFMKPVTNIVERLLNETDLEVFVFTGTLDLIVATPGTLVWVEKLKWKDSDKWHNATRVPLVVDGFIEGYVKEFRNFKMYWINRSGHMVPTDNPNATAAMLEHLTTKSKLKN